MKAAEESLTPETLALFSPRARRVLVRARRAAPPPRQVIRRRLADAGRPVLDAVVDFEQRFGGLHLRFGAPRHKQEFTLGIMGHAPRPDPDNAGDPERTMVPIGSGWNGYEYLYMNEGGEVVSYLDTILMKSSSIVRYLEQLVMGFTPRWRPPRFVMDLRPALGERLASALALDPVDEVTDPYEATWQGPGLSVEQVIFPSSWKSRETRVYARSLVSLSRALAAAAALEPELVVAVGATPSRPRRLSKKQRATAPTSESWAGTPGARLYRFGMKEQHLTGAVWLIERRGEITIQQYRVYRDEDVEELLMWETFTADGGVARDMQGR